MNEPSQRPLIACEDFLKEVMASETGTGIAEFFSLWQSSENLRLQIKRVVENSSLLAGDSNLEEQHSDRQQSAKASGPISGMMDFTAVAPKVEKRLTQSYGGLSRKELFLLLEKHRAGSRNLGSYLLVRAWKRSRAGSKERPDVRLKRLTLAYLERAIAENRADFFREIADILEFFQSEEFSDNGQWNHDPGHWWQFHLLLYILENPKDKYSMREFVRYFEQEVGANEMPTTKTLRAFCRTNGIALDSTPGAPRKVKTGDKT